MFPDDNRPSSRHAIGTSTAAVATTSGWRRRVTVAMALLAVLGSVPVSQAQTAQRLAGPAGALVLTARGSAERQAQLKAFVAKWSSHVEQVYGIEPQTWQTRLASEFLAADPQNAAEALQRTAFDAAMASLHGYGDLVPDAPVGMRPAETAVASRLGDVGADMVYTPLVPCRIVDTRLVVNGRLSAQVARLFRALPASGVFTDQGGSATDCGLTGQAPGAVVLNVTTVTPSAPGYVTIYPSGSSAPLAASVNYTANSIVNNSVVTAVPDPSPGTDFAILSSAATDVVVDIVGFFDTPEATPLQCTETTPQVVSVAGGATTVVTPTACPTDYTSIAANCSHASGGLVSRRDRGRGSGPGRWAGTRQSGAAPGRPPSNA